METTFAKIDYVVFDGKNLIELLQFARSKNVEYIGEYNRLSFVDGNGKKQWINNNDVLVRFFSNYHVVSPHYFQRLIAERKTKRETKDWYSETQFKDIRKWIYDTESGSPKSLDIGDLTGMLSEALNHIEELQNIIEENEND